MQWTSSSITLNLIQHVHQIIQKQKNNNLQIIILLLKYNWVHPRAQQKFCSYKNTSILFSLSFNSPSILNWVFPLLSPFSILIILQQFYPKKITHFPKLLANQGHNKTQTLKKANLTKYSFSYYCPLSSLLSVLHQYLCIFSFLPSSYYYK